MANTHVAPAESVPSPANPTQPGPSAGSSGAHAADQLLELSDGGAMRELGASLLGDRAVHARIEEGVRADDLVVGAMRRTAEIGADWILAKGQGR